jgi:hypothetical protein
LTDEDNNPIRILKTTVDNNGKAILISIEEDLIEDETYNVTINNLNDVTRQEYITEQTFEFDADYGKADKLDLKNVNVIDNQTIELVFSEKLDEETAVDENNYSIVRTGSSSNATPEMAIYDADNNPNTVKLYLASKDKLLDNKKYVVKVKSGMKDYLGNGIDDYEDGFTGTDKEPKDTGIEKLVPISTDAVKLTFSREIKFNATNLLPKNYSLSYSFNGISIKKMPISVLYVDEKTLVLKFDSLEYEVAYSLKATEIIDYAGDSSKGQTVEFKLETE